MAHTRTPNDSNGMASKSLLFQSPLIKICGITTTADVEMLAKTDANAVGLNFVAGSPRCVSLSQGQELSALAREHRLLVFAVVRDASPPELASLVASIPFDALQLHGGELPDDMGRVLDLVDTPRLPPIVKALSWSGRQEEHDLAQAWADIGLQKRDGMYLEAFLVDAYSPEQGGGTGKTADWSRLIPRPAELAAVPLILAGGLNQANVDDAIRQTRCDGVDTASGVERAPGIKDSTQSAAFSAAAKMAFQEIASA